MFYVEEVVAPETNVIIYPQHRDPSLRRAFIQDDNVGRGLRKKRKAGAGASDFFVY
jgi:hypothetical protein